FLIMSVEAQQDSPLRKSLIRIMNDVTLSDDQAEWLAQLQGTSSDSVNFSGLSSSDVRAQCALILSAVESKLPKQEMWAVQAKYGQMAGARGVASDRYRVAERYAEQCQLSYKAAVEAGQQGVKEWAALESANGALSRLQSGPAIGFPEARMAAIKGLSDWLAPSFSNINGFALDCIVAKIYANHVRTAISYRDLENAFGTSKSTFARVVPMIKDHLAKLEMIAVERLRPYFEEQGIVEINIKTA
ncbi:MAG TPA: hypothetical protein VN150_07625, partial [Ochrobactrum sp.]|nr:hypothetical protein [Ochrobactrum sp.]